MPIFGRFILLRQENGGGFMTIRELESLVSAAEKWAQSSEGQKAMEETQKSVKETTDYLSTERLVDGNILRMTFSV